MRVKNMNNNYYHMQVTRFSNEGQVLFNEEFSQGNYLRGLVEGSEGSKHGDRLLVEEVCTDLCGEEVERFVVVDEFLEEELKV